MKTKLPLRRLLKDSIRMYFAPLTGAYKGIRSEFQRVDAEIKRQRTSESQTEKDFSKNHA